MNRYICIAAIAGVLIVAVALVFRQSPSPPDRPAPSESRINDTLGSTDRWAVFTLSNRVLHSLRIGQYSSTVPFLGTGGPGRSPADRAAEVKQRYEYLLHCSPGKFVQPTTGDGGKTVTITAYVTLKDGPRTSLQCHLSRGAQGAYTITDIDQDYIGPSPAGVTKTEGM